MLFSPPTMSSEKSTELIRASKILSERGICSRREADDYIKRGWILTKGRPLRLGERVSPNEILELSPLAKKEIAGNVTIILNKPPGYVSAQPEDGYPPAIKLITPENQYLPNSMMGSRRALDNEEPQRLRAGHFENLAAAGRLDIDSTGLLVFTQSGVVAKRLIGEDSPVEKEYVVRVTGQIVENGVELLRHGLRLDDQELKPARVDWLSRDQMRFILNEGKKRQVRRMCELVGLKVVSLRRVRVGAVSLGSLPLGCWRFLAKNEEF